MEIEASGAEGAIVGVAIGGLEVTRGIESRGVPEAAPEIGDEREIGPEAGDLGDEDGVLVDRAESVVD